MSKAITTVKLDLTVKQALELANSLIKGAEFADKNPNVEVVMLYANSPTGIYIKGNRTVITFNEVKV